MYVRNLPFFRKRASKPPFERKAIGIIGHRSLLVLRSV